MNNYQNNQSNFSSPEDYNNYMRDRDSKTYAMLCHIASFAGFFIPFGNIIGPLVVWLIKKDEHELVYDQGREVMNFQITMTIFIIISALLVFILIGIPILIGLLIFDLIITIIGAIKANEGVKFRYPFNIRFL